MTIERPIKPAAGGKPGRKTALGDALRRRILTMQIAPGAVLDEAALAEEFRLSRPPVREIMRQMAGEGYIELDLNRPARVTSMTYQSLRDFYLVAPMIYIVSTKLAAETASNRDLEQLKRFRRRSAGRRLAAMSRGESSPTMSFISRSGKSRETNI